MQLKSINITIIGLFNSLLRTWTRTSLAQKWCHLISDKELGSAGNVTLNTALSSNAIIIATTVGIGCSLATSIFHHIVTSKFKRCIRCKTFKKLLNLILIDQIILECFMFKCIKICTVMCLFGWFIYYFYHKHF